MTKLGSTSSGRAPGTATQPNVPAVSSWREEFLGSSRVADVVGDDLNELREEDIWEEDTLYGEDLKDVAVQKPCQETNDAPGTKGSFQTRKLRSLLSVEMEAAANFYPSGFSTFSHAHKDGPACAGWRDESGARKSSMHMPHLGNDTGKGLQFRGAGGVSLSVPLGVGYWEDQPHDNVAKEEEVEDEKDEEEGEARLVPPHELVAREYAKSQAMAFSVFEGAGRTLKGMDLCRLRSAVWRRTGFMD